MGNFLGAIQVRTTDITALRGALKKIATSHGTRFLVTSAVEGWITTYPETHGQDAQVSAELARLLHEDIFHLIVHDDDIFAYWFYRGNQLLDLYNSRPDYFGAASAKEKKAQVGHPEHFADLLPAASALDELKELLTSADDFPFAMLMMERFGQIVGLPPATTSYEYILEGEGLPDQELDQLEQIPAESANTSGTTTGSNVSTEAGVHQDHTVLKTAESEEIRKGIEAAQELSDRDAAAAFTARGPYMLGNAQGKRNELVHLLPDDTGQGFWCLWEAKKAKRSPIIRYGPPWDRGSTQTAMSVEGIVGCMVASPSGSVLAITPFVGDDKPELTIWDNGKKHSLNLGSRLEGTQELAFSADGSHLAAGRVDAESRDEVTDIISIASGKIEASVPSLHKPVAIHPNGGFIVGEGILGLGVVDLTTPHQVKLLPFFKVRGPQDLLLAILNEKAEPILSRIQKSADEVMALLTPTSASKKQKAKARVVVSPKTQEFCRNQFLAMSVLTEVKAEIISGRLTTAHVWCTITGQHESKFDAHATSLLQVELLLARVLGTDSSVYRLRNLGFSADGRWLYGCTRKTVLIFNWEAILAATDLLPPPIHRLDEAVGSLGDVSRYSDDSTPALIYDENRNELLWCGAGSIRMFNFSTGRDSTVNAAPYDKLCLSRDSTVLAGVTTKVTLLPRAVTNSVEFLDWARLRRENQAL